MRGLFPEYDTGASVDYEAIWKHALFVFDTNTLLNLYRYQTGTRDELLNVLESLNDRIWIPHHVALEFQRNRLTVIADQNKRFSDVQRAVERAKISLGTDIEKLQLDRRHSLIDPKPLLEGFDELSGSFLSTLKALQETQQKLIQVDPLKERIEVLFDGRVGLPPNQQSEVDELYKEADKRFKLQLPPGYTDAEKGKKGPDEHTYGGIIYKRKYGDFLVWKQLLDHAKDSDFEFVVFVTDDAKEDWWWKVDSNGPKTIGPRPELVNEARREGGLTGFRMYNPEGFLKHTNEFLEAPVSDEALEEVRDVSTASSQRKRKHDYYLELARRAEALVYKWLWDKFPKAYPNERGFPDFVVDTDEKKLGFEVKVLTKPRDMMRRLRDAMQRSVFLTNESDFDEVTYVWVATNRTDAVYFLEAMDKVTDNKKTTTFKSIVGFVEAAELGDEKFEVIGGFDHMKKRSIWTS
ncbi:PIN-like domain-containing protein [Roseobacter sp.]|uniref:PIN-like domain-containing protein n=1 Tax=Roseobacter sp. TaxID=1907202 RepID=UPI00262E226C|nr:PIN domain-containing protein [Roseobacter sp.]